MSVETLSPSTSTTDRYEAVVRISEVLTACREPGEVARTLADEIGKFLPFDHLYLLVLKKTSKKIKYFVGGKAPTPLPHLPMEELPSWHAMASGGPQHTADW